MSALVDEAIKLCRAEELKLADTIRQHNDILHVMKTRVKVSSETETQTCLNDDIPEESELLEQVLKKAMKIRSSSAVGLTSPERTCSSGSARKALSVNDCAKRKSSLSAESKGSRQRARLLKSTADCGDNPTHQILGKTTQSSCSTIKGMQTEVILKNGSIPNPLQNFSLEAVEDLYLNLWPKALNELLETDEQSNQRLRVKNWTGVHVAAVEAEVDVLTQLGLDLTYCYNAALRHQQTRCPEKEYESLLMLGGLKIMMVQVIKEANRLIKDWRSKMAGWHGALCPLRRRIEWHFSPQPYLPPILSYSNKDELQDLHNLRLQVAELKLEIHMHQAMCDKLLDLIPCDSSSSWHLNATALRGVYSLLGEGGSHFPSLVFDTDSNQT
ncbi:hypothetical protein Baya_4315 [Bagarius yarrelli]|uniref:Uncharacterized protein n=1 Tax=Bagarius yarrelli TaxID=175774 RepID=A0A556TW08_BAGYA|nr:hypothetical protein Baya_4315 [Bagarius yarrelli]